MFWKSIFLLGFLFFSPSDGTPEFRLDFSFSELADGWMKFHLVPATWSDARSRCHAEGAVLASPLTPELHRAMVEHTLQTSSVSTIFTGVHTTYAKGVYTSVEGEPLSEISVSWAPGEPDNYQNSESCLAMLVLSNGTMGDVKCNDVFSYICYKKNTPLGTREPIRETRCGTHDTEYNFNSRTGKCYKFHRYGLTWSSAYMTCMAEGAHLAIMNSDEEYKVLRDLFNDNPERVIFSSHTEYAALGFSDPNDGGSWLTIHGQSLKEAGFEGWESGEPNNASQPVGELCGCMARGSGKLYDFPCYWALAFICEKKPGRLDDE